MKENRLMRREPDSMVIHHFQNLHLPGAMHRLAQFIVIHQDQLPLHRFQQVRFGKDADRSPRLIQNWKGFSARRINRVLGRRGKLWQDDYWDRYIRDEAHYRKVVHYIECNPVKAGLAKTPEQWPLSSARFRDEYNRLKTPPKPGAT